MADERQALRQATGVTSSSYLLVRLSLLHSTVAFLTLSLQACFMFWEEKPLSVWGELSGQPGLGANSQGAWRKAIPAHAIVQMMLT